VCCWLAKRWEGAWGKKKVIRPIPVWATNKTKRALAPIEKEQLEGIGNVERAPGVPGSKNRCKVFCHRSRTDSRKKVVESDQTARGERTYGEEGGKGRSGVLSAG